MKDHNSHYPATASIQSCFSEKNFKKNNKKMTTPTTSHIYIPSGHHVNFTALTLVEL